MTGKCKENEYIGCTGEKDTVKLFASKEREG